MSDKYGLFRPAGVASAAKPASVTRDEDSFAARIVFITRNGVHLSYPYSHVGLIECPSGSEIIMRCTCNHVQSICIQGRSLLPLAQKLAAQKPLTIIESEHPGFCEDATVVANIQFEIVEK